MTNTTARSAARRPFTLATLALLALLLHAGAARAQWATSGGGANINNTNTGNVGVGTATPAAKQHVVGNNGAADTAAPSALTVAGGAGGVACGSCPGTAGGGIFLTGGFGSNGWSGFAGNGGAISLTGGGGGAPLAGGPASGTGGALNFFGGPGGSMNYGLPAGAGGALNLTGGTGGNNNPLSAAGGPGGSIVINGGAGGTGSAAGAGGNVVLADARGNVGIGTASPTAKLVVAGGNVGLGTNALAPWSGQTSVIESLDTSIFFGTDTDIGINSNAYHNSGWKYKTADAAANIHLYKGAFYFRQAASGAANSALSWTDSMLIAANGNVGIGVTAPAAKLEVAGQVKSSSGGYVFPDGTVQTTAATGGGGTQWATAGSNNISYTAGNVGIGTGTNAPGARLEVVGPNGIRLSDPASAYFLGQWTDATGQGGISFSQSGAQQGAFQMNGSSYSTAARRQWMEFVNVTGAGGISFWTSGAQRLSIDASGNVGVGAPPDATAKLHVVGNINATGNITADGQVAAKYQDVAEWVPSTQKLAAGTVVTLDPARSNHVLASGQAYDTAVAGVVSAQPGLILGEGGAGKVMVATTGRVRVKVDATKGPIKIGDLLVTSDVAGVAMKSEAVSLGGVLIHRPGTIIGKALEPLEKGVSEILVLLSMQ